MMQRLALSWQRALLTLLLTLSPLAHALTAPDGVTLAVLAYRPEALLQRQYEPLVEYLSSASGVPVHLKVLDQEAMTRAVAANGIDFFLTNPSHFLLIRSERSLTGVLATVQRDWKGRSTGSVGGVIFTRANRDDIRELADLRDKRIGSPGVQFLGGYQAPLLELEAAGLDVRRRGRITYLGNHDRVVRAVVAGDVDAGFIRTGVLEELQENTPGLADELRVLNPQRLRGFPFRASTRLYPEWPLVALPHVDNGVVRRVASALFALEPGHPAVRSAGLTGFSPPADYQSVESLARELRLPPYDHAPRVTWLDVLEQYRPWLLAVGVLLFLLLVTSAWLGRQKRQLVREERRLRELVASWPQPMLIIRGRDLVECNRAAVELLRYGSPASLVGKELAAFSHHIQPDGQVSSQKLSNLLLRVEMGDVATTEWVFVRSDASDIWVEMTLAPVYEYGFDSPAVLCSWYDITRRKQAEERMRLAVMVFDNAREAIFVTDEHGVIMDINDAYCRITGRTSGMAIGMPPPLPMDEGSGVLVTARKQGVWSGEFLSRTHDGRRLVLNLTLGAVFDDHSRLTHFVGVFSDITKIKETERKLRAMAHYDALTGLPNRVLFADRLHQSMAQAKRHDYQLGVIYIDLDEFKPVNDAFGHDAGDDLLVEMARRMRTVLREEDTLARLGGDEFAAIAVNVSGEEALESLLSRLLAAVSEPVWVASHSVTVSVSVGYTLYPQPGELDADQLLRQADQAMYQAKRRGRNGYCGFSENLL
ncbi:diguanylate cyclase domain-containing protein [Marinobacter oulmenensis]|uniref:Diguanylate cyclase (GGDEF)-like protein/PAS domain S-box-containing protein n=1 Tax=Marinobacter oulmenensis TaxID=643747 RepID=A0A840U923_9GAMM|nr:diguanylate cyclase [Marinobacter oulmenensis]MBB5319640.1 diguanylate cyclase (GGDEF)-like protein/PAS domain S-box-containing protein [Marinobacter oulmenensis]